MSTAAPLVIKGGLSARPRVADVIATKPSPRSNRPEIASVPPSSVAPVRARARGRPRPVGDAPAATHHADTGKARRIVGRPVYPAAKRVGLRGAVEHEQGPTRCIAAERPKGDPPGWMDAAGVGRTDELDAG